MTTSSSGLYGNFGQANYGAAKMALVGLMQTLALEGAKYNVRVNCIAPTAATRMLEGLLPAEILAHLRPGLVSPGLLALVAENAPTRTILCAGGGRLRTGPHHPDPGHLHRRHARRRRADRGALGQGRRPHRRDRPRSGSQQGEVELAKAVAAHPQPVDA